MGVRPGMRVMIRLWVAPGTVKLHPAAAAAALAAVMPGTTCQGMPSLSSRASCSRRAL